MADRWIEWHQTDRREWVGYDQWDEKWVIDGWSLKRKVLLLKDDTISESFPDEETAMEVAEFINDNRVKWV